MLVMPTVCPIPMGMARLLIQAPTTMVSCLPLEAVYFQAKDAVEDFSKHE